MYEQFSRISCELVACSVRPREPCDVPRTITSSGRIGMRATQTMEHRLAFLSWVSSTMSRVAARRRRRRQLVDLLDLPDYLLRDIGLQRDEIFRERIKRFWKD